MTFTTAAFDRSSSWRFEAFPYRTAPKGPPSSLVQHGALAACGGLEPAPDSRLRGTYPHLLHSIAPPFVSAFVAHGRLLKPQPGRPQRTEEGSAAVPLTGLTIHNPFVVLRFTPKRLYI